MLGIYFLNYHEVDLTCPQHQLPVLLQLELIFLPQHISSYTENNYQKFKYHKKSTNGLPQE